MNSGYSGVDPGKFPGSPSESEYSQSSYLGSHSDYYSHMQTAAAAQHYGYGASAAAAMSGYPNPRDPMGYSNYCQQYSAMSQQQVMADINDKTVRTSHCLLTGGAPSAFFVFLLILLI